MVGNNRLLLLLEAQSTWTVNILIRILLYLAQSYHEYFKKTSQSLYKSTKVKIPKPELYIIYTGNKGRKPDTISLSKEFFNGADIDIEVKAKVIYESDTKDIINQYIIFCKVFDEQRKLYGMTVKTVKETICICKDRNVLKEYLISREKEVVTIMMSLFDEEEIMEIYWQDKENTLRDELTSEITNELTNKLTGEITNKLTSEITNELTNKLTSEITDKFTDEKNRETRKTVEKLIKKGKMPLEDIAECFPTLSLDELKEIQAKIMQLA